MSTRAMSRSVLAAILITVLVALACVAVFGIMFVTASTDAKNASADGMFPRDLFGLMILEGFHRDGRFGVHIAPGAVVFLIVPLLVGVVSMIPSIRLFLHGTR